VVSVIMTIDDGPQSVYLVDANNGHRWVLESRDLHDGIRFRGRQVRDA
jgi:hypothetical protein